MKKKYVMICLLLIFIISSLFILKTSYFQGHDLDFHLSRIISIKDCMEIKKICYVAPNYLDGYGYGTPLFYPELFLIIPSILLYFGLSLVSSYKIFIILINVLSILSMYFCVNKMTKSKQKSLISSFLYAFASYRVIDISARAALGEFLSFIFFPIVILGIYEIVYGDYRNYKYLIIGMSGIILSHVLSSVIIFIYLVIFCLINIKTLFKDKKRIKYLIISALVTFLLTSYFTLPMIEQLFDNTFKLSRETTILKDRAMPFYHIFFESPFTQMIDGNKWLWSPGTVGTMFILIIILYFMNITAKEKNNSFIKNNMIISLIFIFLTTRLFPWNIFQHIFNVIQFPWRFSIIPSVLLPIIGGSILYNCNSKGLLFMIMLIGIFSIKSITTYHNITYVDKNNYHGYDIMWEDYLPISLNSNYIKNRNEIISSNNKLEYNYKRENNKLIIDFNNNNSKTFLELPFVYYKGYSTYINRNKVNNYMTPNGLLGMTINKKYPNGKIEIFYEGTIIQKVSLLISLISLITYVLFERKIIKIK